MRLSVVVVALGTFPKYGFAYGWMKTETHPEDPPVLKILRRVNFGTESKFGTDAAKRYGEGSEMLVFRRQKWQENGGRKRAEYVFEEYGFKHRAQ